MSLFQSISGFISSAIVGPENGVGGMTSSSTSFANVMTSALNAVQPALSSDRTSTSGLVTGRSRPSSTSSSSAVTSSVKGRSDGPDLSHLSAEEQQQIEAVLARAAASQMTDVVESPAKQNSAVNR